MIDLIFIRTIITIELSGHEDKNRHQILKIAPIPATHCYVRPERGPLYLQVLPDDPRDDAHSHAPLHIQAGDGKGDIILFPRHPQGKF